MVDRWLVALENKDMSAALTCSAWLSNGQEIPMFALRNISYELSRSKGDNVEFSNFHRSGSWLVATIRCVSGNKTQDVFLPIVMTPDGARLLPEIDLIAEDTRTRNFLNTAAFERLGKIVPKAFVADLQKLFEEVKNDSK